MNPVWYPSRRIRKPEFPHAGICHRKEEIPAEWKENSPVFLPMALYGILFPHGRKKKSQA